VGNTVSECGHMKAAVPCHGERSLLSPLEDQTLGRCVLESNGH